MDPIHRNAFWGLNAATNHHRVVGGVTGHVYLGAVGTYKRVGSFTFKRDEMKLNAIQSSRYRLSGTALLDRGTETDR